MNSSKTVTIHQPNFFPWLGYFEKIARSDIFIFLDSVQFPKKGGSWTNRVKLLVNNEPKWITAAIDRAHSGTRRIQDMTYLSKNPWRRKLLASLETNYRRHPFFEEVLKDLAPLIENSEENVAEYNIAAISKINELIGLDSCAFHRSSDLGCEQNSNELLCSLTRKVGGNTYMCGGGADGYQDESVFVQHGIELIHQEFIHPIYLQQGVRHFTQGLSVIDAAMNIGWRGISDALNNNNSCQTP